MTSTSVPILSRYNEPWHCYIKFLNVVTFVYSLQRTAAPVTSKRPSGVTFNYNGPANVMWCRRITPSPCKQKLMRMVQTCGLFFFPPSSVLMLWLSVTIFCPYPSLAGGGRPERASVDADSIYGCTKTQHALFFFVWRVNRWVNMSPVTSVLVSHQQCTPAGRTCNKPSPLHTQAAPSARITVAAADHAEPQLRALWWRSGI